MGMGGTKRWMSDSGWGCILRTTQTLLATALGGVGNHRSSRPQPSLPAALAARTLPARVAPLVVPRRTGGAVRRAPHGARREGGGEGCGNVFWAERGGGVKNPRGRLPRRRPWRLRRHRRYLVPNRGLRRLALAYRLLRVVRRVCLLARLARARLLVRGGKDSWEKMWGDRPVLLLLGIRLGLDGVNPIYYETIKADVRSSCYYFVGVQGDGLFYLDPHHSRPAVPLRPFAGEQLFASSVHRPLSPQGHGHSPSHLHASSTHAHERRSLSPEAACVRSGSTSPESGHGHSFARGGSLSPELVYHRGGSMSPDSAQGWGQTPMTEDELVVVRPHPRDASSSTCFSRHGHGGEEGAGAARGPPAGGLMAPAEEVYYARAYSAAEVRTFHCERVRRMPLSGLDPSMLIGSVCRDEAEWIDLRRRIKAGYVVQKSSFKFH
ncbi:hypothetical protein B0H13DRAFT_2280591 [Mycena leptocephala]|nr:hypothetical protein B0H13DRAFT_2280591 [Mycena leptocephala]